MKTSRVVAKIDEAIAQGKLQQPFRPVEIQAACPGFAESTYHCFLPKHAQNNPDNNKVYFERVKPGVYRRIHLY